MSHLGAQLPIVGYTGHLAGGAEVFGRTPVMGQLETKQPKAGTVLAARTAAPVPSPRDPVDEAAQMVAAKAVTPNLWPSLQSTGAQDAAKPPASCLRLGDERIPNFVSSYSAQYAAPFDSSSKIRSPLRNAALQHVQDLRGVYASAFGRVGESRLQDIMLHMRERLAGKLSNRGDNGCKLRKLFKVYDPTRSGLVGLEDFRVSTESFGMQLDDDSLLAIFFKYDPEGTGFLRYHLVMKELLDSESYALWAGGAAQP